MIKRESHFEKRRLARELEDEYRLCNSALESSFASRVILLPRISHGERRIWRCARLRAISCSRDGAAGEIKLTQAAETKNHFPRRFIFWLLLRTCGCAGRPQELINASLFQLVGTLLFYFYFAV